MPTMWVTTDLVGLVMIGIGLFAIGFILGIVCSVVYAVRRRNKKTVEE